MKITITEIIENGGSSKSISLVPPNGVKYELLKSKHLNVVSSYMHHLISHIPEEHKLKAAKFYATVSINERYYKSVNDIPTVKQLIHFIRQANHMVNQD